MPSSVYHIIQCHTNSQAVLLMILVSSNISYNIIQGRLGRFTGFSVLFSNRFFRFSFYKNRKTVIT
jgi:hypothetical protein